MTFLQYIEQQLKSFINNGQQLELNNILDGVEYSEYEVGNIDTTSNDDKRQLFKNSNGTMVVHEIFPKYYDRGLTEGIVFGEIVPSHEISIDLLPNLVGIPPHMNPKVYSITFSFIENKLEDNDWKLNSRIYNGAQLVPAIVAHTSPPKDSITNEKCGILIYGYYNKIFNNDDSTKSVECKNICIPTKNPIISELIITCNECWDFNGWVRSTLTDLRININFKSTVLKDVSSEHFSKLYEELNEWFQHNGVGAIDINNPNLFVDSIAEFEFNTFIVGRAVAYKRKN